MSILVIFHIMFITLTILIMKVINIRHKYILNTYVLLMIMASLMTIFMIKNMSWKIIDTFDFTSLIIVIVIGIFTFVVDFFIFNMVKNEIILLDIVYYFKGKIDLARFGISIPILIMEEIVFRSWINEGLLPGYLSLVLSSICFGLVHIFFSKYDVYSKTALGIVIGCIFLYTGNIFYAFIVHLVYNYLSLKRK